VKIKCPSCGFENDKEARFCEKCKEPLPNPYIKKKNNEDQSFKPIPGEEAETKNRIEKEERIRAEAKVKAEKEIKKKEQKKQSMGCLVFLILAIIVGFFMFKPSKSIEEVAVITPEIKQEIKTLNEGSASKYISITDIKESSGSISVDIELLNEPESYDEVKMWTDAVCEDCYKILKEHNIDYFIHVWAKRPKGEDFIKIYGKTDYDKYSGVFKFKNAEELNL